jgi:type IV pilus assembly protein PilV
MSDRGLTVTGQLKNQSGYYMLQVLIGLFLFGLCMMGLAQLGYASMMGNRMSQHLTDATTLAQERLEEAKSLGFADVDTLHATKEGYGRIAGYDNFARVTQVDYSDTSINIKRVQVDVYWNYRSKNHNITLQTILSR